METTPAASARRQPTLGDRLEAVSRSIEAMNLRIRIRISALVAALLQSANLSFCAVLLSWQARSPSASCRTRTWVFSLSQVILSSLRLVLMGCSAALTYKAGRAAVQEALFSEQKTTKSKYETRESAQRDAETVVALRSATQHHYDWILWLHSFAEPAFSLVQLGFSIAITILFAERFEECSRGRRKAYVDLSMASLACQWGFVCFRLAYGPEVITWRGLFGFKSGPWEKHYQEKIEHLIRFLLCCFLRKPSYMFVSEDARGRASHPVAMGLAKMFQFRAHRTASMIEFFRALDHIRREDNAKTEKLRQKQLSEWLEERPLSGRHKKLLLEATSFVRFSSASYTGIALDLIRMLKHMNPFLTMRRQELFRSAFSPQTGSLADSNMLEARVRGDSFYGGHTKAFVRYACIDFDDVLGGRIGACEGQHIRPAAMSSVTGLLSFFVVRSEDQRTLIISIRGTADMEDVLIDLNAFEGVCLHEDVGLENPDKAGLKGCGWAHYGVLEATREVYLELMGENRTEGILPRLMNSPEYEDWALRVVGQSLGAAVASLLTLRLRKRYPHIHCFAYNSLPVVDDNVVATVGVETCKALVTQVTCDQDVVSRCTFPSVMRMHERVCREIIRVQQANPWRGRCCPVCCPDARGLGSGCNFVCNIMCHCLCKSNDHLHETFDAHGRCPRGHKSPTYVISTPEELGELYRRAQEADRSAGTVRSQPMTAESAWKPEMMTLDTSTRNVVPELDKSNALLQSLDGKKKWMDHKTFKERWENLRSSISMMDTDASGSLDDSLNQQSHIELSFGGIKFVLFGEILDVVSCLDGEEHAWFAKAATPEEYEDIVVCDSVFTDHVPWNLEAGLNLISERIVAKRNL